VEAGWPGSAAPLPVAPPAGQWTDRGFPGGIKAKRKLQEADLSRKGARRKDGRELKAAQHSAGCVCSLWEKATRTRYSVQARLAAVAWGASAMDSNATLQHCAVAIPQRPVDVGGWFGPRKGGLLCAAESLAHLGPPEQTAGRAK
jgi:hypothetical protein